jgi:hypothetical protein
MTRINRSWIGHFLPVRRQASMRMKPSLVDLGTAPLAVTPKPLKDPNGPSSATNPGRFGRAA